MEVEHCRWDCILFAIEIPHVCPLEASITPMTWIMPIMRLLKYFREEVRGRFMKEDATFANSSSHFWVSMYWDKWWLHSQKVESLAGQYRSEFMLYLAHHQPKLAKCHHTHPLNTDRRVSCLPLSSHIILSYPSNPNSRSSMTMSTMHPLSEAP